MRQTLNARGYGLMTTLLAALVPMVPTPMPPSSTPMPPSATPTPPSSSPTLVVTQDMRADRVGRGVLRIAADRDAPVVLLEITVDGAVRQLSLQSPGSGEATDATRMRSHVAYLSALRPQAWDGQADPAVLARVRTPLVLAVSGVPGAARNSAAIDTLTARGGPWPFAAPADADGAVLAGEAARRIFGDAAQAAESLVIEPPISTPEARALIGELVRRGVPGVAMLSPVTTDDRWRLLGAFVPRRAQRTGFPWF